jgi:hypothetical protein
VRARHGANKTRELLWSELDTVASIRNDHPTLCLIGRITLKSLGVFISTSSPADAKGIAASERIDAAVGG